MSVKTIVAGSGRSARDESKGAGRRVEQSSRARIVSHRGHAPRRDARAVAAHARGSGGSRLTIDGAGGAAAAAAAASSLSAASGSCARGENVSWSRKIASMSACG
jgi:hypothetical protein